MMTSEGVYTKCEFRTGVNHARIDYLETEKKLCTGSAKAGYIKELARLLQVDLPPDRKVV